MWGSVKTGIEEYQIELAGQIELAAKDLDHSILAVNLRDSEGKAYLIDDTPIGEKLLRAIGERVSIRGFVRRDGGLNVLRVDTFSLLSKPSGIRGS